MPVFNQNFIMSLQGIKSEPLAEEVDGLHEVLDICFDHEDEIPIKEEMKLEIKNEPLDKDNLNVETPFCKVDQEKRDLQAMVDKLLIEKQNLQVENQIWKSEKTNEERQLEKEVRKLQVENQNLKEQLELSVLNSHKNEDKHLVEAAKKFKKSDFAQNLENPETNNKEPGLFEVEECIVHKCEMCTGVFINENEMKQHFKAVHQGSKDHKCESCGKSLTIEEPSSSNKKRQRDSSTSSEKSAKISKVETNSNICTTCNKQFGRSHELQRHMKSVHQENSIECPNCDQKFARKDNLKKHITRIHENKK